MKGKIPHWLFWSLLFHLGVALLIITQWQTITHWWGGGQTSSVIDRSSAVWVDITVSGDQNSNLKASDTHLLSKNVSQNKNVHKKKPEVNGNQSQLSQRLSGGEGESPTPMGGVGEGVDASHQAGDESVLKKIRQRILSKRVYPVQARKKGIEGVVKVAFELKEGGQLRSSRILQSSGHAILDEEALATLVRAQPYPYYSGEISLALTFALEKSVW